jgi:hypothetical protein
MEVTKDTKYEATKHLSLAELAKRMRTDIADLHAEGVIPERVGVVVRVGRGDAINITVSGLTDDEIASERDDRHDSAAATLARTIRSELTAVHSAYNSSSSYPGQDYPSCHYYGAVTLLTGAQQRFAERQRRLATESAAKARAYREAAAATGLAATIRGGRRLELVITAAESDEERDVVELPDYYRKEMLTTSVAEYLLGEAGWQVMRYNRRSRTNPEPSWSVTRAPDAPQLEPLGPGHADAQPNTTTTDEREFK